MRVFSFWSRHSGIQLFDGTLGNNNFPDHCQIFLRHLPDAHFLHMACIRAIACCSAKSRLLRDICRPRYNASCRFLPLAGRTDDPGWKACCEALRAPIDSQRFSIAGVRCANRSDSIKQILPPLIVGASHQPHDVAAGVKIEGARLAHELHAGFVWELVAFPAITGVATRHQILPRRRASTRPGHYMVECQFP